MTANGVAGLAAIVRENEQTPVQSAPPMANGITASECCAITMHPETATSSDANGNRRTDDRGQGRPQHNREARARNPSTSPVIADTKRLKMNSIAADEAPRCPMILALAAHKSTRSRQIDAGPSSRNMSALFIEVILRFAVQTDRRERLRRRAANRQTADAETPAVRLRQHRVTGYAARPWKLPSAGVRPWRPRCGSPACRSRACRARSWSG